MGGNAIKNVDRMDTEQFQFTQSLVISTLLNKTHALCKTIPFYHNKDSFGDIDIVVSNNDTENVIEVIKDDFELGDGDYVKNGNVFSFRAKVLQGLSFQVDLIFTPMEQLEIAQKYFAYNDLSNLLGRMTKKLGFKLGHNGLFYVERNGDHIITDECFSYNYYDALIYLELDVERYKQGFDTLEEVFEYVASSPYFNPDIYLLHNRNHISRTRDKKRKTYREFLEWCEKNKDSLTHYPYDRVDDYDGYGSTNNTRIEFTKQLLEEFPALHYKVLRNRANYTLNQAFKQYFNGRIVADYYNNTLNIPLEGKELGRIMSEFKYLNTNEVKLETIENKEYDFEKAFAAIDTKEKS